MEKPKLNPQQLISPEFRVSHPHLWTPQAMKGTTNDPKFSLKMLAPKDSDISPYMKAIKAAMTAKFGADESKWPQYKKPVVNGDAPKYADKEGYKGNWVIGASAFKDRKPGVLDQQGNDIVDERIFYPGCYAKALLYASVYEFPVGSKIYGVKFALDGVQKTRDGKSFSTRKDIKEVFGAIAGSAATANQESFGDDSFDAAEAGSPDDEDFT